jgi:hypothetical protein
MGVGSHRHVPAALPPGKRLWTQCTAGWVGPRAGLDVWMTMSVAEIYKMVIRWMKQSMEHWWDDMNKGNPKYSEKSLSHCHKDWLRIKPGCPRWEPAKPLYGRWLRWHELHFRLSTAIAVLIYRRLLKLNTMVSLPPAWDAFYPMAGRMDRI